MGFKCGIVGLPNVGKSTIFNALTNAGARAANFPFCTKDPNVGIVQVPDERFTFLVNAVKTQNSIPAVIEFVDIAGLVKGASEGNGLGNQFLSHIRDTNAIMHVVRCFENVDVTHVEETLDAVRDAKLILTELILKDIDTLQTRIEKDQKLIKNSKDADLKKRLPVEEKILEKLNQELPASKTDLSEEDIFLIQNLQLLTLKPMFFCVNVSEDEINIDHEQVKNLRKFATDLGCETLKISGQIEAEITKLDDDTQKKDFLQDLGLKKSGIEQVIQKGYSALSLNTYFTASEKEVRAWTFPTGTKAPQAAGIIHSDFARGFIRAETISYQDFKTHGSWQEARSKGAIRTEGKEYLVQDGDIIHFLFNV